MLDAWESQGRIGRTISCDADLRHLLVVWVVGRGWHRSIDPMAPVWADLQPVMDKEFEDGAAKPDWAHMVPDEEWERVWVPALLEGWGRWGRVRVPLDARL